MKRSLAVMAAGLAALGSSPATALDNGLARTPPMGWNSWNKFQCNVSESLIRETADAMASSGMKEAGYQYVVIDDCWQVSRDASGQIVADPERFPSGIKALADYVHSKGLKFGLYSDAGDKTCGGRPGSRNHEAQDARTYAAWGVDYVKYDWCHSEGLEAPAAYAKMSAALAATGRPILFSICEWGHSRPWTWGPQAGNMWRTTGDIVDAFDKKGFDMAAGPPPGGLPGAPPPGAPPGGAPMGPPNFPPGSEPVEMGVGVLQILDRHAGLAKYAGPGGWNDPDMLQIGNGGMTLDEQKAHFAIWAMLAAPLIAGNDLRSMTPEVRAILTDREVIAVSQDPAGKAGDRVMRQGDADVWARPLAGGGQAVMLLNRGASPLNISVTAAALKLPGGRWCVRDLSDRADRGEFGAGVAKTVGAHAATLLRVEQKAACSGPRAVLRDQSVARPAAMVQRAAG